MPVRLEQVFMCSLSHVKVYRLLLLVGKQCVVVIFTLQGFDFMTNVVCWCQSWIKLMLNRPLENQFSMLDYSVMDILNSDAF